MSELITKLSVWIPGLRIIPSYKKKWLSKDLTAGLSVAAISLPVGIAYADLAGLPAVTGLYSCILPLIGYALFGTSRQLIVGPDSSTCILLASSLSAVAAAGSENYQSLAIILTILVGILSVAGGLFKLGFIANFLSKPILIGYLNGLALSIISGQLGKLCGFKLDYHGFIRTMIEFFSRIHETNSLTLIIGVSTFVFLRILKTKFKKMPAPLLAVIVCIIIVGFWELQLKGVAVVGYVPAGFPPIGIPDFHLKDLESLIFHSVGIVIITFCSGMLTDKSFAVKNGYQLDSNKEFIAFGVSNLLSGISHGYAVSGADSRTAVNDTAGGKTQLVSVIAAAATVIVVLFLTGFMEYLPVTTLSAIIISASIGLFDFKYLGRLFKVSRSELFLSVITSVSVITIGVMNAVYIAVGLSLIRLLARTSKPNDAILGKPEGSLTYHDVKDFPDCRTVPGLLIYRYEAALLFFNSDYFKNRILDFVNADSSIKFVLLDASTMLMIDVTAADMLEGLVKELQKKGIGFGISKAIKVVRTKLQLTGLEELIGEQRLFETVHEGVDYFKKNFNNTDQNN